MDKLTKYFAPLAGVLGVVIALFLGLSIFMFATERPTSSTAKTTEKEAEETDESSDNEYITIDMDAMSFGDANAQVAAPEEASDEATDEEASETTEDTEDTEESDGEGEL